MNSESNSSRRSTNWRRFSLRTMFVLIVLTAPLIAYIGYQLNQEIPTPRFWDERTGENIKWTATIGSVTYSSPALSDKYVFIPTSSSIHNAFMSKQAMASIRVTAGCETRTRPVFLF